LKVPKSFIEMENGSLGEKEKKDGRVV